MAERAGREEAVEPATIAVEIVPIAFVEAQIGAWGQCSRFEQEAQQALGRTLEGVETLDHATEASRGIPRTARRTATGDRERAQTSRVERAVVGIVRGIGGVEDESAQVRRVARRV